MGSKIKRLLLLVLLTTVTYSAPFRGEYEEGFVAIEINRTIEHTFFPVYMDFKEEEPYIGLRNLMVLVDARAMEIDTEKQLLFGKIGEEKKEFSYEKATYIERGGDVFIKASDLGKVFPLKKVEWNIEKYQLKIETEFKTPVELYLESEGRREEIDKKDGDINEEEIYRNERKLMTPGVLRPRYTDYDLGEGDENISVRYDTHLLYGDFSSTYFFRPDSELGHVSLTYNEILEEKSIVAGDSFLRTYNFLNTSSIRGGAIVPWYNASNLEIGATVIKGFAPFRSTVELYQNGSLLRFQTVGENGQYEFDDIRVEGYGDSYTIKIYNFDGTIETRELNLLSNRNILEKNKFEYTMSVGESQEDQVSDDLQYYGKVGYGVTDRLTFAMGYGDVQSSITEETDIFDLDIEIEDDEDDEIDSIQNEFIETALYYTTKATKYPIYLELANLYDVNEGDNTHVGIIRQKIKNNDLSFEVYDYGRTNTIVTGSERTYLADWRSEISEVVSYNAFYYQEDTDDESEQRLGANLYLRYPDTSHSIGFSYPVSDNDDEPIIGNYSYSNSKHEIFKVPVNIVLSATVDLEDPGGNALYSALISKRGTKKFDISFEVQSDTEEYAFILELSYKLTNWLDIIGEATRDEAGETETRGGIDAEKTIILEKPFVKNSEPSPSDAWLEGKVYLDYDGDRVKDEEDILLEDVTVKVGRKEGITDSEGRYFIDGISSYEDEKLEVDITTIDPLLEPSPEKGYVRLYPSRGGEMDIPLQPISIIMGDVVTSGVDIDEVEKFAILSKLNFVLKDEKGNVVMKKKVEAEGYYMLERVLPGSYTIEVEYGGESKVEFKEKVLPVEIKAGKYGDYYENYDFEILDFIY